MTDTEHKLEARGTSSRIVVAALGVTAVFSVAAVLALFEPTRAVSATLNVVLFLVGVVVFLVAFFLAAGRSREEEVWFGGVFFLSAGVVAGADRRLLLGLVVFQVVVSFAVAIAAPFTGAAFATLVPLTGLALVALFGAVHARFLPKGPSR